MLPYTVAGTGRLQGMVMVVTFAMGGPDEPLGLSLPPGDDGETGGAAVCQIVDPLAGFDDRDQERFAAPSFDRRIVRGHMDDALNRGRDRATPGGGYDGDVRNGRPG